MRPAHAVIKFDHVTTASVNRRRSDVIENIIRESVEANIVEPTGMVITRESSTFSLEFIPTIGMVEGRHWIEFVEKAIGQEPLIYLDVSFRPDLKIVADVLVSISSINEEAASILLDSHNVEMTKFSSLLFFGFDKDGGKRFTSLRTVASVLDNAIELNSVDDLAPGHAIAYFVVDTAGIGSKLLRTQNCTKE